MFTNTDRYKLTCDSGKVLYFYIKDVATLYKSLLGGSLELV